MTDDAFVVLRLTPFDAALLSPAIIRAMQGWHQDTDGFSAVDAARQTAMDGARS